MNMERAAKKNRFTVGADLRIGYMGVRNLSYKEVLAVMIYFPVNFLTGWDFYRQMLNSGLRSDWSDSPIPFGFMGNFRFILYEKLTTLARQNQGV
jgi:hypothetical protein